MNIMIGLRGLRYLKTIISCRWEQVVHFICLNLILNAQQHYVFLKAIILDDEEFANRYHLERLDINDIEKNPGEIQYFDAAAIRQQLGVENVRYSQNRIMHDYVISEPKLITYTIPYNKGWKAYANGKQIPLYEI